MSKPGAPWSNEETEWARECLLAGDTIEEIAAFAGRSIDDVTAKIGSGKNITPANREVLSLYAAGCTFVEIDATRGCTTGRPGSAAASMMNALRHKGLPIPYRNNDPRGH